MRRDKHIIVLLPIARVVGCSHRHLLTHDGLKSEFRASAAALSALISFEFYDALVSSSMQTAADTEDVVLQLSVAALGVQAL
jgi:hypothetical protein